MAVPGSGGPWEWRTLGVADPGSGGPWEWWAVTVVIAVSNMLRSKIVGQYVNKRALLDVKAETLAAL